MCEWLCDTSILGLSKSLEGVHDTQEYLLNQHCFSEGCRHGAELFHLKPFLDFGWRLCTFESVGSNGLWKESRAVGPWCGHNIEKRRVMQESHVYEQWATVRYVITEICY